MTSEGPAAGGSASRDDSFVHLHVHTEYSMLDGAARLTDLFEGCERLGMPALAMTDHGNLYGAFDFAGKAAKAGIKPIIGTEAYIAPGSRFDKRLPDGGNAKTDKYSHMTLWAADPDGYANLIKLSSLASLEGYYYKPRMDRELLSRYAGGIIGTTGCPGGEVSQALERGDYALAKATAGEYAEIFGRGNFYVELMQHGIDIERRTFPQLVQIAKELDLPLVATNDLHYTQQADHTAHEVLLCVQTGATLADPTRFKFEATEFYLKSPAEMRATFAELPEACDNTLVIAERIQPPSFAPKQLLPQFPCPEGESEESWFRKEVARGVAQRYPRGATEAQQAQVDYEVGVILQMGFPAYFLVVADLVRYAKTAGIRVGPGRGSAAGSMVSYVLGITELDPLQFGLIFERFLNPDRISMPDIDMDFDERRRTDMIRYATERYGDDKVAQIITYGTIKAKAAIKDSSRVLGYPYAMGDKITKAFPAAVMGREMALADCFDPSSKRYSEAGELRALAASEPDVAKVLETARGLEGLKRQVGVHAAGVVMCRDPLTDHVPVWRRDADGAIITQFDMGAVESLGLLKMDFLGLRNLTVLDDCLGHIESNRGETLVLEELTLDDPEAYALLGRGDSLGVFQLDGGPMRSLLRAMKPTSFDDISALIALYRPGPMGANAHNDYADRKNGRKPVEPIHPELAEALADILDETHGLIVYQEQVMAIAQRVAGYTLGAADLLRRAMGKKKREILDKEYIPFSDGMKAQGFGDNAIKTLWDILVPFSDYAFNKAHSAGYGLVSYWTAFLKANYPAEYMAALLTSVRDDKDKTAIYLQECRRMGLKVLPPDVNDSDRDFTPRGTDIRFGLGAIRNVGANVVDSLVRTRKAKGRFGDFADFLRKVEPVACNKRTVESLIKAGAFDSLGHPRRGLVQIHAEVIDACLEVKRAEAAGQFSLFGGLGMEDPEASGQEADAALETTIPNGEWEKKLLLAYEREMLGLYVSDHPLLGVEHIIAAGSDATVADLSESCDDGQIVTVGGIVATITRKVTKTGNPWAVVQLEDLDGGVETLFFPQTYAAVSHQLIEDEVVLVKARVDKREEMPRLIAMELIVPDLTQGPRGPLTVSLAAARCVPDLVTRLKGVLSTHPGTTEVRLQLLGPARVTTLRLDDGLRVSVSTSLVADLKELLGAGCVSG
ncbi:MAG TPA: DNA polymerase III subunit alpha [Frankiaceae bacterium]|nr:DNA polymerase III subunit alpha [Frankiaceae bacterium]